MKTKYELIFLFLFLLVFPAKAQERSYQVEGNAVVGYNLERFNNRPLFCNNTPMFILTGDKPLVKVGDTPWLMGTWMVAFERQENCKWLFHFDTIKSIYTSGKMTWEISDNSFPGVKITMTVVPTANSLGMVASLEFSGTQSSDRLIWSYGGAMEEEGILNWKYDVLGDETLLTKDFSPASCKKNHYIISGNRFTLHLDSEALITGLCSQPTEYKITDPEAWQNPAKLLQSNQQKEQLLTGVTTIPGNSPIYFVFHAFNDTTELLSKSPEIIYREGVNRTIDFENRIRLHTPNKDLNALVATSVASLDALWNPPVFSHGTMLWNKPYLGWRSVFGATVYGWHERVKECAAYYLQHQVKESTFTQPKSEAERLYVDQADDSRFYGKGYIDKYQYFYNMQSQFFDQLITEWRYTADKELEDILYPALELHLEWVHECFDPDGDGLFESYRNSWPTDSHWYNGGGTAEETAYVYKAHLAAMDMCALRGDTQRADHHKAMTEHIRKAFNEKLWIKETGHSAKVVEQMGLQRQHPDPWLYSIFLPADVGIIDKERIMESLYYTQWALENVHYESGGRMVYTSNFVPGIWSVRELWPGENYHLALAYFKANQEQDAWDIFNGTSITSAWYSSVPANLGNPVGGIDFADCSNTFARTLVEGILGYNPDYPNGKVTFEPGFPQEWPYATAKFPDFTIDYKKTNSRITLDIELLKEASIELRLPVNVRKINSVTVDGKKVNWEIEATFGKNLLVVETPGCKQAKLVINYTGEVPFQNPVELETIAGETFTLSIPNTEILSLSDPQGVLSDLQLMGDRIEAKAYSIHTYHTIILSLLRDGFPQKQAVNLVVRNPELEKRKEDNKVREVPQEATWSFVSLDNYMNADVRTVYQQEYLTPRPNTVSLRIGSDGYSAWTFPYWESKAPAVELDSLHLLQKEEHLIETPQRVPFRWNTMEKNIAFTSLWDNFPRRIAVPVNQQGEAIWFLVCGTTNPMQCNIANAVIKLVYSDGIEDKLELIPPANYWNLSNIYADATEIGQDSRTYYFSSVDRFCLPEVLPETIVLGKDCRAMVLNHRLRKDKTLLQVELETLSSEVVVGLMGMSVMNPGIDK